MVEIERIVELAQQITREYDPERIILFGSYAYGTPTASSDIDLLVILPFEGHHSRKAVEILNVEILNKVDPRFPVDLLARTPEQVRQRLDWNDFFMKEIVERGRVLYEA